MTVAALPRRFSAIAVSLSLLILASCTRSGSEREPVTKRLKIERYMLSNGLEVILHEDHDTPKVAVTFLVKTGSKDEPDRRSGFAHLFEHLMFMGTKRVPQGEYDKIIESYGGEDNAYTAPDLTVFYANTPAQALPTLLWLEADRLDALGENIDQKKLDLQRDVVLNERRQTTEDEPYGEADEAINQLIYPPDHPYHRGTIGSPADLRAATVQDVKDFFATYYVPNNITLVVAGNFASKDTKPLIKKLFGPLDRRNDVTHNAVPQTVPLGVKRVTYIDNVSDPRLTMVWKIPAQSTKEYRLLSLASQSLSSRLNATLVDDGVASSASATASGGALESTLTITASPTHETKLDDLENRVNEVLRKFRKGITDAELQGATTASEAAESAAAQDVVERSISIATDTYYYNDPYYSLRLLDSGKASKVGRSEINAAVKRYLDASNHLVLTVLPESDASTSALNNRPADITPTRSSIPKPTEFQLSNGMKVTYWQVGHFGTTYLQLLAGQGTGSDKVPGTTELLTSLLDRGARTKDFDLATDRLGASISAAASNSQLTVSTRALSRNLSQSLRLTREVLESPLMTPEEFEDERTILAEALDARTDDPRNLSYDVATFAFYGQKNPFGKLLTGSQVRKVKLADVAKRRDQVINPGNMQIVMAGDLDPGKIKTELNRTIGKWHVKANPKSAGKLPDDLVTAPEAAPTRLLFIDSPGAAQTMIRVFSPAVKSGDPNALNFGVLGTVLGGTFTSRLNTNLREDKGYTYGANASYAFDRTFGLLNTRASVDVAVTGKSIAEIQKEFTGIEAGISKAELLKAVQTEANAILDAFANPEAVVQLHSDLLGVGQTQKDLVHSYARLLTLTEQSIDKISPRAVDEAHALWVLVGDRAAVLPQLTGLGLPKPEVFKVPK